MTILSPKAVRRFIDRERRDYSRWKSFTLEKLQKLVEKLPVRPPVWSRLSLHQKVCLLIGIREEQFAFFLDTGMGKTFLSLALMRYFRRLCHKNGTEKKAFLVLVPNRINKRAWVKEVKKHQPSMIAVSLVGSTENKWKLFYEYPDADLYVDTYIGFARMISKLEVDKRRAARRKVKAREDDDDAEEKLPRRVQWNESLIKKFCAQIDGLIMDESIFVMNRDKLYNRVSYQIRKRVKYVYELNATPFGRDPQALFGQLFLIDLGYTLGETLALFRAVFCIEKDNFFGGSTFKFNKNKKSLLAEWINNKSISYEVDEGDLPKCVLVPVTVRLPAEATEYAERFATEIAKAHGNYQATKNAFLRMRQVSSGFLGFKDDESGERASFTFSRNPKLEALIDYIHTIPEKYKLIIFHEFNYSGKLISDRLKKEKLAHVWVYGKTKRPEDELDKWEASSTRILLLSNASGAFGGNLQAARYGLHYELPVSPVIWYQAKRRYERQHSRFKTVFRVLFTTTGTYDESIYGFLTEGEDLFDAIIRGRARISADGSVRRARSKQAAE